MSVTDLIDTRSILLLAAALVVFGLGQYWWYYKRAKRAAEDWLRHHHYRVIRLRLPWFSGWVFGPAERLADEQLALMRRIAAGESTFAPRRLESDGAEHDEMVEHLLALSRRGMITCSQPTPGIKGRTQYSDVSDVALTAQGQSFLASRPES